MKPFLDVPFLPEAPYTLFLKECAGAIDAVQFRLDGGQGLDSRVELESIPLDEQVTLLAQLDCIKKYALLNSRFYKPSLLTRTGTLSRLIDSLERYLEHGVLDGIIYCDHYLLQRLSDSAPEVAAQLEAIPGVNMMLDSIPRIEAMLAFIGTTHFRPPGKIVLDRSLNRNLDGLATIASLCRRQFPGMKIELLANEGCLLHCPFKLSHDAYISLANLEGCDHTHQLNFELGCMRFLGEHPHRILQSPFIRPEDTELYLGYAHNLKLCGRSLGSGFLQRVINAYRDRRYVGNLLDLLDATHWLASRIHVDNSALSFDFANMLSRCASRCEGCGHCPALFQTIARDLPLILPDQRNII